MAGRVTVGVDFIANFDGSKLSSQFKSAMNGFKVPKDLFDVSSNIKQLQNALKTMKLPSSMSAGFTTQFNSLEKELLHYQDLLNRPVKTRADVSALEKSSNKIHQLFNNIITDIGKINSTKIKSNVDSSKLQEYQSRLKELKQEMASIGKEGLSKAFSDTKNIDFYGGISKSKKANDLKTSIENAVKVGDIDTAKQKVLELEKVLNNLKAFKGNKDGVTSFKNELISTLDSIKSKSSGAREGINEVSGAIKNLKQQGKLSVAEQLKAITEGANVSSEAVDKLASSYNNVAQNTYSKVQQVSDLKNQVQYFFGLQNQVFLFRRAVRDTIDTVKELDASMTETAVVTDFSVSDMWAQLPEYTAAANELGSTINDVYKANTLYFQQGLDSEQAMGLGIETLKMARIAGMDAAKATDLMTAALRGFNMELNQTSAQRVNDVYSKLAAITASDTQEIGTAVSKTASLASSAGMDLEQTSALLAQVVETTREPPETAGTALKTIIARFGELKELYTQGQLTGEDENGEEIVVNRVDKALQTAGISLKEFIAGNKGLGEIFVELSKKWDSLSTAQQRYIATQSAGSRQQSRFIAMLQDTERLQYLLDEAYNSNGASAIQFEKTQESVEAKTNKLKNAWDEFTMGFMNEKILKGGIDAFRVGLSAINDVIESISEKIKSVFGDGIGGLAKGALTFGAGFASLGVAGKAINSLLGGFGGMITPGDSFLNGLKGGFVGGKDQEIINAINSFHSDYSGNVRAKGNLSKTNEEYRDFTRDNYVKKNEELRGLLKSEPRLASRYGETAFSTTTFDAKKVMDSVSEVPPFYQNLLMKNNPGIAQAMERDFKEGFSKLDLSDAEKALALKYQKGFKEEFKKDKATFQDYIGKSFAPSKAVESYGAELGGRIYKSSVKSFVDKYGKEEASKKVKDRAEQKGIKRSKALNQLLDEEALNKQVRMKGVDNLAQKFSKVGSAVSSAGVSVNQFGVSLQAMGFEKAGAAAQRFGNIIMGLGPAINSLGQIPELFAKANPIALAFGGIATVVGAAVFGIKKYQSKVREEAEDIQKNYEKISKSATENIDKINSIKIDFSTLAKGVDEYGNNLTLNDTQYKDYIEDVEKLTQMAPELIKGYNAEGKAIIDKSKAIEIATKTQKKNLETAQKEYTSPESMDTMIKGIQQEKKFKKYKTGTYTNSPYGQQARGLGGEDPTSGKFMTKQIEGLRHSLKCAHLEIKKNQSKVINDLAGREINLFKPSAKDLQFISEHATDIKNTTEKEIDNINKDLTSKQRNELQTEVNKNIDKVAKGWRDIENEIQPLMQQTSQYLFSKGLGFEKGQIGEEFATAFSNGIKQISLKAVTENWSGSELQDNADKMGTKFKLLSQSGSEYHNILNQVAEIQEKYQESVGQPGAIDEYASSVSILTDQLRNLGKAQLDGTAAGEALAESISYQADQIDSYAQETEYSLTNAIDSMEGNFAEAKSLYDNFSESIKEGDYYTAGEGIQKMYGEVMDGVDNIGRGSQSFWKAVKSTLSENLYDESKIDKAKAKLKEVNSWFEEGNIVERDKNGDLSLNINGQKDLEKLASALNVSVDSLTAAIDKNRQFIKTDTSDYGEMAAAIRQDKRSAKGMHGEVYYNKSLFDSEVEAAVGPDKKAIAAKREEMIKRGIEFIDFDSISKTYTKKQKDKLKKEHTLAITGDEFFNRIGYNRKSSRTLDNVVGKLMDYGVTEQSDIQKILDRNDDILSDKEKDYSPEDIATAMSRHSEIKTDPVVSDIKSDTQGILNTAQALLVASGILPKEVSDTINKSYTKEEAKKISNDITKADESGDNLKYSGAISDAVSERDKAKQLKQELKAGQGKYEEGTDEYNDYEKEIKKVNGFINGINQSLKEVDVNKLTGINQLVENGKKPENLPQTEQNKIIANADQLNNVMNVDTSKMSLDSAAAQFSTIVSKAGMADQTIKRLAQSFVNLNQEKLTNLSSKEIGSVISKLGLSETKAKQLKAALITLKKESLRKDLVNLGKNSKGKEYTGTQKTGIQNSLNYVVNSKTNNEKALKKGVRDTLSKSGFKGKELDEKIQKTVEIGVKLKKEKGTKDFKSFFGEGKDGATTVNVKPKVSGVKAAKAAIKNLGGGKKGQTIKVNADISKAKSKAAEMKKIWASLKKAKTNYSVGGDTGKPSSISDAWSSVPSKKETTYTVSVEKNGPENLFKKLLGGKFWTGRRNTLPVNNLPSFGSAAQGVNNKKTSKNKKEGMTALTGEKGYEVAWFPSENRSTILGLGGPEIVDLPKDAVVYNHDQSKKIVKGNQNRPKLGSFDGGVHTEKYHPGGSGTGTGKRTGTGKGTGTGKEK